MNPLLHAILVNRTPEAAEGAAKVRSRSSAYHLVNCTARLSAWRTAETLTFEFISAGQIHSRSLYDAHVIDVLIRGITALQGLGA